MIIGVSGKSGSGKSSVANYLKEELGYTLLELDKISKDIREEYKEEIISMVKEDVLTKGKIDSKKLGVILFNNERLLDEYNMFIYQKLILKINEYKDKDIIIDSLFLPIMEIFDEIDINILVICSESKRINRILNRDKISKEYFDSRDRHTPEYDNNKFDYIINTDEDYHGVLKEIIKKITHI